jgi:glycosyltransferase involved in cell wall biosynthesis
MLVKLLSKLHGKQLCANVIALSGEGPVSRELRELGISVDHLNINGVGDLLRASYHICTLLRQVKPDVLQGWMYHGNIAATFASVLGRVRPKLVWSVRQSLYDLSLEKPGTRSIIRMGACLSRAPDIIIYNSEIARNQHEVFGFDGGNAVVINNGFDSQEYRPNEEAYRSVREELCVSPDTKIVGMVARYHPMKGHAVFMSAIENLSFKEPVHFVMAGKGVDAANEELTVILNRMGKKRYIHLLGERDDMPRLTAAFDVAVCASSWGEGFPNAIGEAMSCGVPCVATDVGDVRRVIGETGVVVARDDPDALADALVQILRYSASERRALGNAARTRTIENFSLEKIASHYSSIYLKNA